MKKVVIMVMIAVAGGFSNVNAQKTALILNDKTGWHKIGETTVNFQKDTDEVTIIGADKFAAIEFKVDKAPINLVSLEVFYDSGDTQTIKIDQQIKKNGQSKFIDLNGGERDLKKVVFVYKTVSNQKDVKAHVELWGYKTNTDRKN